MTVDQFVAKWNGKALDFDGAYGNQCWDLAAQYSREVVGLQGGAWDVMPTGPNGGAIEVFTVFKAPLGTYYNKIANSPDPNNLPIKGDLVIWNWGTFGHIALCLGATSASISVFEQNSPVGSLCHITNAKQWSGCVGWIRPKQATVTGGQEVFNTIEEVKEAYLQMRGVIGTDAEMRGWIGQSKQRWIQMSKAETDGLRAERDAYRNQLASVQQALANEQAKPPKEVVKTVEKIVTIEVPTEVRIEVPVPYDEKTVVTGFFKKLLAKLTSAFWGKG